MTKLLVVSLLAAATSFAAPLLDAGFSAGPFAVPLASPEPSTFALMALAGVGVAALKFRRKK